MTCTDVALRAALDLWASGAKLDGYCIHGVSTVWLGRWGKVFAFVGALTIVIDLVGEARVHDLGDRLRARSFLFRLGVTRWMRRNVHRRGSAPWRRRGWWRLAQTAAAFLVIGLIVWFERALWGQLPVFLLLGVALVGLVIVIERTPLIMGAVLWPIERVLGSRTLCGWFRVAAATFLLAAFALELLTS